MGIYKGKIRREKELGVYVGGIQGYVDKITISFKILIWKFNNFNRESVFEILGELYRMLMHFVKKENPF